MTSHRALRLALGLALLARGASAEPLLFVGGTSLASGEVDELLPLPDGNLLRATDVIAEFVRTNHEPGETLAYDVATRHFREDVNAYLGDASLDRLPEPHEWYLWDSRTRSFMPLGAGPVAPASAAGADGSLLATKGVLLLATARVAADADADGIPDNIDVCTLVPNGPGQNGGQRDTDGDGYGNICDPDLNEDGVVNARDLAQLKALFFTHDPNADLDGDGVVNAKDLARLKSYFFKPPGPSGVAP